MRTLAKSSEVPRRTFYCLRWDFRISRALTKRPKTLRRRNTSSGTEDACRSVPKRAKDNWMGAEVPKMKGCLEEVTFWFWCAEVRLGWAGWAAFDSTSEDGRKHIPMPGRICECNRAEPAELWAEPAEPAELWAECKSVPKSAYVSTWKHAQLPRIIRSVWIQNLDGLDKCLRHYNPETLRNLDGNANFGRRGQSIARAEAHFTLPPFTFWTRRIKIEWPKALRSGSANFGRKCWKQKDAMRRLFESEDWAFGFISDERKRLQVQDTLVEFW